MTAKIDYRLYLATDDFYLDRDGIYSTLEDCLKAGITVLQYRAKERGSRAMLEEAVRLRELTRRYGVPLIVNDRLDIALAVEADGLHLGQSDLPITTAKKFMGGAVIGVSATSYGQGTEAIAQGADYVGVGPIYPTLTKKDAKPPCGFAVVERLRAEYPAVPLVAIGGITADNAVPLIEKGVAGVAVISAILGCDDPAGAVRRFARAFGM